MVLGRASWTGFVELAVTRWKFGGEESGMSGTLALILETGISSRP